MTNITSSKTEIINTTRYCIYCAKVAKTNTSYDEYYASYTHDCDCEGALLEKEQESQIQQIRDKYFNQLIKFEREGKVKLNQVKYVNELYAIQRKYNII